MLPVPTTSPPQVTERSYRTAIRIRAVKLPRRSGLAARPSGPAAPATSPVPKYPSTIGLMSTSSLAQPRSATTASASARDAGDDVRYGMRTQSSRSGADRLGDEVGDERRVDAAREAEDGPLEAGLAELAADEPADDPARDVGVDRQLGRQLEQGRAVRARMPGSPVPPASRARRALGPGFACRVEPDRPPRGRLGGDVEPGLGASSAVESGAMPARSAMIRPQLADLQLRALVAQQRQGDPLAADVGRGRRRR